MGTIQNMYCLVPNLDRTMRMLLALDDERVAMSAVSLALAEDHIGPSDRLFIDNDQLRVLIGEPTHINVFEAVGSLLVIGPMQERLRAAAISSAEGGFVNALIRMGVPGPAATCYSSGLRMGRILLSISGKTPEDREAIDRVLVRIANETKGSFPRKENDE